MGARAVSQLTEALESAYLARRGPTAELEAIVRAHARARRLAGDDITSVLIDVKSAVRACTLEQEPVFTPKVVGWTVAGFYAGSARE
jgi:hypothetical protein